MRRLLLIFIVLSQLTACTHFIFQPMKKQFLLPDQIGLEYRDIYFDTSDGLTLHGWFLPAKGEKAKGTILFLHGNAENITTHIGSVWWMPTYGYNVFLYDYRGYGLSEGKPTLDGLHLDLEAALQTLFTLPEVDNQRIAVFGQSLGGSIAITGLAQSAYLPQIRALIVEGAFANYRATTREILSTSWITWPLQWPLSFTIDNRYRPEESISHISPTPVLIIHGDADLIIKPHNAETLYRKAGEPKELWIIPGAAHIATFKSEEQRQRLDHYLQNIFTVKH